MSVVMAFRTRTGVTPKIEFPDAFFWAAWQAGRMAMMATTPKPPHIRSEAYESLRKFRIYILRHSIEWAIEAGPLEEL